MELPLPEELEARRKKYEEILHPIRGHIQTVRPPQSHPGNTKADYIKELHDRAEIQES